jgi:importin subunit beta-1
LFIACSYTVELTWSSKLCMQVIIQKLGAVEVTKYGVVQYADNMMGLFLRVFACRSATVHEEAMLSIRALAYATGAGFEQYMSQF